MRGQIGPSYPATAFQIREILNARDALELIDSSLVKPEGDNAADVAELNRWKKANKVAKAILITLDKKSLSLVMTCETATCEICG